ncbi:MAG: ACP S-malonyltransferase [Gemmatimonadota bacterium]|nr:ACP S-malonyltransferase [Gemmatimonadota bacterium]
MKTGLLFPGQGSQHVGMGQALAERFAEARDTFAEADDTLGFGLSGLAWEGPEEVLTATENAQPALFVHSVAAYRVVRARIGTVAGAAGHSLGELSAHAAAGTYSFADGLRAVRRRGQLMARAGEETPGTMAAILGLGVDRVDELCREAERQGHTLVAANLNADGQVVVSGDVWGISWVATAAKSRGARRIMPLKVSAAFHSPLMGPAAEQFAAALNGIRFRRPSFPVVSNVTARAVDDPDRIRELLVRQLTAPVRWIECVEALRSLGASRFAELGPGKVLAGLNRRNARGIPTLALGTPGSIESLEQRT